MLSAVAGEGTGDPHVAAAVRRPTDQLVVVGAPLRLAPDLAAIEVGAAHPVVPVAVGMLAGQVTRRPGRGDRRCLTGGTSSRWQALGLLASK